VTPSKSVWVKVLTPLAGVGVKLATAEPSRFILYMVKLSSLTDQSLLSFFASPSPEASRNCRLTAPAAAGSRAAASARVKALPVQARCCGIKLFMRVSSRRNRFSAHRGLALETVRRERHRQESGTGRRPIAPLPGETWHQLLSRTGASLLAER
jgi:hypothetical protein